MERAKTASPEPAKVTESKPPVALLPTLRFPVLWPVTVGLNVTLMVQPSPAFSKLGRDPQVFVSSKSPVMAILLMVMVTSLLLNTCTICGWLVSPMVITGKLRLVGETVRSPVEEETPFPVRVI